VADTRTVPQALGRLRVALDASFARVSSRFGLSPQQAELLCAAMRPTRVGHVAHVLRCDRTNVTRLADRAERRGLLRRVPGDTDHRVTLLEVTPEGHAVAEEFIAALEAELSDLLATWSQRKQQQAVSLLDQLAAALEQRAG
jgi:DNA-binding MarR family transcriptional regulator